MTIVSQVFFLFSFFSVNAPEKCSGEGKRRHEFAEWHVAWHNNAKYDTCGMTQRNKLTGVRLFLAPILI